MSFLLKTQKSYELLMSFYQSLTHLHSVLPREMGESIQSAITDNNPTHWDYGYNTTQKILEREEAYY